MKKLVVLFSLLSLLSCRESEPKDNLNPTSEKKDSVKTIAQENPAKAEPKSYSLAYLKMEDVLLNGNKILLNKTDFEKIYRKIDSTRTDIWECGNPLDFLDEEWMIKTYGKSTQGSFERYDGSITTIYTQNVEFITNNHMVLFDRALTDKNTFKIISADIVLDKNTTIENFEKLFPNAVKEEADGPDAFRFRITAEKDSTDAFFFDFENGKLYSVTLWFHLC
jgi:hypothetical protein